MLQIRKRNGVLVPFDKARIIDAVNGAFIEVTKSENEISEDIANKIKSVIETSQDIKTVEDIQNMVESFLMKTDYPDVAQAYIRYRYKREVARNSSDDFIREFSRKVQGLDIENSNANLDEMSFGGRVGSASDLQMKKFALEYCMSKKSRENHENNEIYIHDLNNYALGTHNCFARSTKFITWKGVKSFYDFEDGNKTVVLAPDGRWYEAIVKKYEIQPVNKYILQNHSKKVEVIATPNHRWINEKGEFQEGLKIRDKLFNPPFIWQKMRFENLSEWGRKYWCYGFILGDGLLKNKEHLSAVEKYYLLQNEDKIDYIPDFDKLPPELLNGFALGLFESNGKLDTLDFIYKFHSPNDKISDLVEKLFPVLGLYINSVKQLNSEEKEFELIGIRTADYGWWVKDIIPEQEREVWCLEVEDVHSFVLAEGIPTGNCLTIPFDDLLANGFNTRQTDVRPANSINTAFQLLAVIFQLQSLCQFG